MIIFYFVGLSVFLLRWKFIRPFDFIQYKPNQKRRTTKSVEYEIFILNVK